MHVPIEGIVALAEKIEDRSRIGAFRNQWYVENPTWAIWSVLEIECRNQ
jgi:hypothetical protein